MTETTDRQDTKRISDQLGEGRYEVIEKVGHGGMGEVYRARHRALEKDVALKVLFTGRPKDRFLREAKLLAQIESPYVVAIHDFDVLPDGTPFLAMEWVRGTNLANLIEIQEGPLSEDECIKWMQQICEGMTVAAAQGVVHRDLKPSNILIDPERNARVADFGLARGQTSVGELSFVGQLIGTPYYMAPEQAEDPRRVDTRADIYSFGATFYHALTSIPPFSGETPFAVLLKHKLETPISPKAINSNITTRTSELLERCLAKSPSDRFSSFEDLRRRLYPEEPRLSPWDELGDHRSDEYLRRYRSRRNSYLANESDWSGPETYNYPDDRMVEIVKGNIVDEAVDAIVSSDDDQLSMSGGVSWAIRQAAGSLIEQEARRYAPVRPGRAVVTSAGNLSARFIFHGITMRFDEDLLPSRDLVLEVMSSCFYHADTLGVRSVAFPLLGTGAGGLAHHICLDTMFHFLTRTLLLEPTSVKRVRVVLM
jgi:serine/threonine protein kinase